MARNHGGNRLERRKELGSSMEFIHAKGFRQYVAYMVSEPIHIAVPASDMPER